MIFNQENLSRYTNDKITKDLNPIYLWFLIKKIYLDTLIIKWRKILIQFIYDF